MPYLQTLNQILKLPTYNKPILLSACLIFPSQIERTSSHLQSEKNSFPQPRNLAKKGKLDTKLACGMLVGLLWDHCGI